MEDINESERIEHGRSHNSAETIAIFRLRHVHIRYIHLQFLQVVGRRDLFEFDLSRYQQSNHRALRMTFHFVAYVGKYLILFPVVAFAWFAILTTLLAFLARGQTINEILRCHTWRLRWKAELPWCHRHRPISAHARRTRPIGRGW